VNWQLGPLIEVLFDSWERENIKPAAGWQAYYLCLNRKHMLLEKVQEEKGFCRESVGV
jgi:hypothetical protein